MLNTIKYTVLELVRIPGIMIWALLFPLVLMSVFAMMFEPLNEMESMNPIRIVVVEPDASIAGNEAANQEGTSAEAASSKAFTTFIDAISNGEDRLLDATYAPNATEAKTLVVDAASSDDSYAGYVQLVDGKPQINLLDKDSISGMQDVNASILKTVMDEYTARVALFTDIMENDPQALANPAVTDSIYSAADVSERIDVTRNQPHESVRYYFALLGMAALFGANLSLIAFQRMKPNVSMLGGRRMVGSLSHSKAVAATLVACWLVGFACLVIAYAFMRFVVGISFGGRDAECIFVTAIASITSMSLGCAISAIPKVPEDGKTGILTGIVCFSALFAGLYGQPTMELADLIAANAPAIEWINPASQISQAFYSIMYYDDLVPMFMHVGALLAIAAVLFVLSVGSMRRQRYASL